MTELEQYIKSYFENIQSDELNKMSALFESTTLKKGGYFLKAGKHCDKICIIQTGVLRVFAIPDKEEVTQWIATKGYLGTDFSSFLYDTPSRWTIQALTDTELFTLSKPNYRKVGEVIPQWTELEKLFLVKCFTALENRIFSHLSMTAEERYNLFFTQNNDLFNQVPLKYIASMLGMTPETLSRIRKKATF